MRGSTHDNAFGAQIEKEKLNNLMEYFNTKFPGLTFGDEVTDVDYAYEYSRIDYSKVMDFANNNHLYGNQIPQPKFAFKFVMSGDRAEVLGKRKNTLKIKHDNVDFIGFHQGDIIDYLTDGDEEYLSIIGNYDVTIIGRPQVNEFRGNKSLQIVIDEISCKRIVTEMLF